VKPSEVITDADTTKSVQENKNDHGLQKITSNLMKQVAGTGLKNPLGWNLSYKSNFRPSPDTNQILEPNQYSSFVGLWHQDWDLWQWCPGITDTRLLCSSFGILYITWQNEKPRIQRSYKCEAQLQVWGAATSVRHSYKCEVQLQVWGTATSVKHSHKWEAQLHVWGTATSMKHSYKCEAQLQVWGTTTRYMVTR